MNLISKNIKFLRKRKGRTQEDMAFTMGTKRSTLNNYENEIARPGIEKLIAFSEYFCVYDVSGTLKSNFRFSVSFLKYDLSDSSKAYFHTGLPSKNTLE